MKNSESVYLSFKGYEVIKVSMNKVDVEHIINDDNIGFVFKIVPDKKKSYSRVNIIQGVKISPTQDFPYEIEVILKGNFELSSNETDEKNIEFLITNASAILFPYLRSTVSLLSSQLEYEKIILPVVNFSLIFKDLNINSLILDHNKFESF